MAQGGARAGAGRKRGSRNKATAEIRALALDYGPEMLKELARLAGVIKNDDGKAVAGTQIEATRISALGMLMDRAYGKALPWRLIEIELPDTSTTEGVKNAVAAVVRATAMGEITTGEASDLLCSLLEVQRRAIELSDIEARLATLEAAQQGRGAGSASV
jgi:hypothetical protein